MKPCSHDLSMDLVVKISSYVGRSGESPSGLIQPLTGDKDVATFTRGSGLMGHGRTVCAKVRGSLIWSSDVDWLS